jgi:uncharacterized membrane protein
MHLHRLAWMQQMVRRENRITDANLIGHVMSSVSFFASTTIIVVAALLSALHAVENIRAVVLELPFAYDAPIAAWHVKVLILIGLFIYAFFKFTWAIRQWNYCCVMVGTAPPAPVAESEVALLAERAARVASSASLNFNSGLRAYYFALGMLAWFVHPVAFMVTTLWVLGVLAWRQFRSPSAEAIVP